ncbi:bifunctional tetrahydrofolate synthase/dihydrofolate synthase [Caldichromatium japonicum]|uniref:Dihydrofolate synthase/folylpolyglutamate synthase n=1 Tax=Caldichromatium japonicum TaxID=2699430 RepID=A0A6G7VAD9_9GAMM|nr:bifunctional tetrahydrofolate synthase/dihydrofolate synthase [Caldichromatium japonicum]QIK36835.1 bifunctional tetrahydrofolate synthase/dihydrofolate synthase [Caldichromatium japonicum]
MLSEDTPKTLDHWLAWLVGLHPRRIALGLERIRAVWSRLGAPRPSCPVITVGGTNGKGSTVAMIEAIARAAGYRCGAYTSPHLLHYNERMRIEGQPVSDEALCAAFARIEAVRGEIPLTYFEFGTLAALDLFARAGLDLVVLEVGLGGRLDAVNLIDAEVAVVTTIGLDHTEWLGETLDAIAREKAGIFRPGRPAIIGQRDAPETLRLEAERIGAISYQLGREFDWSQSAAGWRWEPRFGDEKTTSLDSLPYPAVCGPFQLDNASAAIAALMRLPLSFPAAAIEAGLRGVSLSGRFQVLNAPVTWVLDVAHNAESASALAANLRELPCSGRLHAVFAVLNDKPAERMAAPLARLIDRWYLTQTGDERALSAKDLAARLAGLLGEGRYQVFGDIALAIDRAAAEAQTGDGLVIFGSFTTVAAALRHPACPRI